MHYEGSGQKPAPSISTWDSLRRVHAASWRALRGDLWRLLALAGGLVPPPPKHVSCERLLAAWRRRGPASRTRARRGRVGRWFGGGVWTEAFWLFVAWPPALKKEGERSKITRRCRRKNEGLPTKDAARMLKHGACAASLRRVRRTWGRSP